VTALLLALAGASGVYLVYTALVLGWEGLAIGPARPRSAKRRSRAREWLVQAGLADVKLSEFAGVMAALFVVGAAVSYAIFGGVLPAVVVGAFAATFPPTAYRARRHHRRSVAQEAWPRMIEEIRILTSSIGRSIPQALFEVGRRAPDEMRPAFEAAHREWLLSTDFARTVAVLKAGLADPTADATCETLLVAHEVGGSDLDRRLEALVEDRIQDTQGRKDARAEQAGVRFARRFVLIVPVGMAFAGMSVGEGRAAYKTAFGQVMVVAGIAVVVACWLWAGRIMRLPEEERVFFQ
jgi:tight adherence protein B